jgi:hypothetical protein
MTISVHDRKRLWGLSASRCEFPDCRQALIEETSDAQGAYLVGQECHIVAKAADGPRGNSDLGSAERDSYSNLVLLCSRHHIVVDNDVRAYPVEKLLSMKAVHELWVRQNLALSLAGQADLERWGEIIDQWASRSLLDQWTEWSSDISNAVSPRMPRKTMEQLTGLGVWLIAIIWPGTLPELEQALRNFHRVLTDFIELFNEEADAIGKNGWALTAIPSRPGVVVPYRDREREQRHADVILDLAFELTRAANYVCAMVRSCVDPRFRLVEGALLMSINHHGDEAFVRPEYSPEEASELYPGVDEFLTLRFSRDFHCPAR